MSAPVESAITVPDASAAKSNKDAILKEHLNRMAASYQSKAWFKWQGDPPCFGLLCVNIPQYPSGNRFATIPLFDGDNVPSLRNGGFKFADNKTWADLDNVLVKFQCTFEVVPPARNPSAVVTFWTPDSGTGIVPVLVATLNIPNGPSAWDESQGYTSFL